MRKRNFAALVLSLTILASLANISETAEASYSQKVNVWWPANGAQITGKQPFKVMLENSWVNDYQMFWQVDGGQWNWMDSNFTDYPHKEVEVDITGWSWKGVGPYKINFIARDYSGKILSQQSVDIYNSATMLKATPTPTATPVSVAWTPAPIATPAANQESGIKNQVETITTTTPAATPTPTTVSVSSSNPFQGKKLYVNPYSDPKRWADANRYSRPSEAALMDKIGNESETQWYGNWNSNVYEDVKNRVNAVEAQGAFPVIVAYNIPGRDCGSYSAGGSANADAYRRWIRDFANGIGTRAAAVILEPDAIAGMDCLSSQDKQTRIELIKDAIQVLNSKGKISVYIDAGNPHWKSVDEMSALLKSAGIEQAKGFSLNISNFFTTQENIDYGTKLSSKVGGKHFIIETSRNGSGPTTDFQWCNPSGRSLGNKPTTDTGHPLVDAMLWIKGPAGSDGQCNGGPAAGIFWPEYALELARRTSW